MSKKKDFPRIAFQVAGHDWQALYCPTQYMNRKYGRDILAVTECDERRIYLRVKHASYETITHEVFHAYIWETGARSMNLTVEQMEELCAEQFSKHAKKIIATAELIQAHVPTKG